MSYMIRKATDNDKTAVLALGRKIVDVYERTHLGDEMATNISEVVLVTGSRESEFL